MGTWLRIGFCIIPALCLAQHPRLYLTPDRITQLQQEIGGVRQAQWLIVQAQADNLAKGRPPVYVGAIQGDDPQQLWQRDVGNALPTLAMAWVLTGNAKYKTAAHDWALASCSYPTWGFTDQFLNKDLAAAHQLFGLALVYDWMQDALDPSTLETIHQTLLARGRSMYQATDSVSGAYWRDSYLQNHLWVAMAGLAAAGFAMPQEAETADWLATARAKFQKTEDALGSDGASHEGVGYWSYGVEHMLKYWALSADLFNEDLRSPWWQQTALYRIYLGLPRNALKPADTVVDLADCVRQDWYGPDYLLFNLAHRFQNPQAQWLALQMEQAKLTVNSAPFLNLIWFDPKQPVADLSSLPTLHNFADLGIVSSRMDWSGDETLVVFKSGPPLGQDELTKGFTKDPGLGHVHPDANHFVLFGNGQWLVQDDGYRWKETGQHNTLLVDGAGQLGEGNQYFTRKLPLPLTGEPTIESATSNLVFDFFAGEASGAYGAQSGLQRFARRLIFVKQLSALLVLDDIQTDRARKLELRFHPVTGSGVQITDLTPDNVTQTVGSVIGKDRDGGPFPQDTVAIQTTAAQWRHVTAIVWPRGDGSLANTTMASDGDQITFQVDGQTIQFDWGTSEAVAVPQ